MASESVLAARAAWLHLVENRTHVEIAELLGIGRIRVPKLVAWATEHGVASIRIRPPGGIDAELAERLRREFGLAEALVSRAAGMTGVARLAARYLAEILADGGVLGIAWGSGAQAVVEEIERLPRLPQADVVQLIGGIPAPGMAWHATDLLVRLTAVLGGSAAALLSPMIVPDAGIAGGLRSEPSIAHAFAEMSRVDVALLGVGAWREGGSRVRAELAPSEVAATRDVVADACGVLLNAKGESVHSELTARIMSIDEPTLRSRPVRVGLAVGQAKADALRAVLRAGLLSVVATDAGTARLVLGTG